MASRQTLQSLTSATSTDAIMVKEGIVAVTGTFSATWRVEIDPIGNGTWAPALDAAGAALTTTAAGAMKIDNGVACPTRVTCTAYTSGTLVVAVRD